MPPCKGTNVRQSGGLGPKFCRVVDTGNEQGQILFILGFL